MCSDCDDDADRDVSTAVITDQLMECARHIELDFPGNPVSDEAWLVFFGQKSGGVPWADHERMARCREAAQALLALY